MTAAALRSLFVKEVREQGWAIPALFAVEFSVAMIVIGDDASLAALSLTLMGVVPLAAVLLGINVGAGEASRGTLAFLHAQPVRGTWIALAKLSVAAVSAIVASLLALAANVLWRRADPAGVGALALALALSSLSFVCWSAAASLHQKDEVRGACAALAIIAGLWLAAAPLTSGFARDQAPWQAAVQAALPGGGGFALLRFRPATTPASSDSWSLVVLSTLCGAALPAAYFLRHYGQPRGIPREGARVSVAPLPDVAMLPPPHASTAGALIWKQQRETAPLALAVVLVIVVFSALVHGYGNPAHVIGTVFGISAYLGVLASLVAGVGLFVEDLRTAEHEFWRSRPIPVDQWFWTKYVTGWSVLVVALAIPTLVTLVGVWLAWGAAAFPTDPHSRTVVAQAVAALTLAVSASYGTSAAVMSFVRRPVLAAALALAIFLSALGGVSEAASRYGDSHRLIPYCWLAVGIAFSIAMPLVAWRRVRALAA